MAAYKETQVDWRVDGASSKIRMDRRGDGLQD